jgi:hypothetical protein
MEAVTAVKIQMVYEKLLNNGYPRTAIANETKNKIRNGPEASKFPEKIKTSEIIRKVTANASAAR